MISLGDIFSNAEGEFEVMGRTHDGRFWVQSVHVGGQLNTNRYAFNRNGKGWIRNPNKRILAAADMGRRIL